jgi:formylglycine-generating enzyme required for sulfatase activity
MEWTAALGRDQEYPWGAAWPPPVSSGNYLGNEGVSDRPKVSWPKVYEYDDGAPKTASVAQYAISATGFFDLGGNVWEWCEDSYTASMNDIELLEDMPHLESEITGDGKPFKVLRGGAWSISSEVFVRSSTRYRESPNFRVFNTGFRLIVEIDSVKSVVGLTPGANMTADSTAFRRESPQR